MELGQKLKQARLAAGLSQRQLCGQMITRNMLSQIENGSARPSWDTLQYLADRLGKPLGYFLEDGHSIRKNLSGIYEAKPEAALKQLLALTPEPEDQEYKFLLALTYRRLSEEAAAAGKSAYALTLLEKAENACRDCVYKDLIHRSLLLLRYRLQPEAAPELAVQLPSLTDELMLLAQAALQQGDPEQCGKLLDCAATNDLSWHYLRAEAFLAQKDYLAAAEHYLLSEALCPQKVYARLEQCYRELKNYEKAYEYAVRQR